MKKSTKKSLLFSVLALILCTAMLLGTTFAWFTDSASTAVNKIQAGTLDVALEMKNAEGTWVNAEGQTLAWQKAEGHEREDVLWEPGCTYQLPELRIVNKGNLALKYKIAITGIKGDAKLNEAIEWTIDNQPIDGDHSLKAEASNTFNIKGHMKETAGNEYQGLSIDGVAITVLATQDTVEFDSTTDQYDVGAEYAEARAASTAASFAEALIGLDTTGNQNVVINVVENINNITGIKTANGNDLAVDFGGNTVTVGNTVGSTGTVTNGMQLLQGSDVTLRNGTYKPSSNSVQILVQNYSDLTLENVTLDATSGSFCKYVLSTNCGDVVIKGNTNIIAQTGQYALDVMHWENNAYKDEGTSVVFDQTMTGTVDGKIDVYCYSGSVRPVDDGGATLTIMGGTFKNTGLTLDQFKAYVPSGYKVVVNSSDGSWTVQAA